MEKLRITLSLTVNRIDDGTDEIYARAAMQKAQEFADIVGRGKYTFERTVEVINKRRLSVRKPNKRRK
jgi:hypothetical protein